MEIGFSNYFIVATSHLCHGVSNHHQLDSLFNSLFMLKKSKHKGIILPAIFPGNPPVTGEIHRWPMESPHKGPLMWKSFLCHNEYMESHLFDPMVVNIWIRPIGSIHNAGMWRQWSLSICNHGFDRHVAHTYIYIQNNIWLAVNNNLRPERGQIRSHGWESWPNHLIGHPMPLFTTRHIMFYFLHVLNGPKIQGKR